MGAHNCDCSTWEARAEELQWIWGQSGLQSEALSQNKTTTLEHTLNCIQAVACMWNVPTGAHGGHLVSSRWCCLGEGGAPVLWRHEVLEPGHTSCTLGVPAAWPVHELMDWTPRNVALNKHFLADIAFVRALYHRHKWDNVLKYFRCGHKHT